MANEQYDGKGLSGPKMTRRTLIRSGVMIGTAVLLAPAASSLSAPAASARGISPSIYKGGFRFVPSGIDGGGFVNVLAVDSLDSSRVVAGSDVAGFQLSTNYGNDWTPSNTGVAMVSNSVRAQLKVASIVFSRTTPNKVYSGNGRLGANGGFFVSTDGGRSWDLRSTVPQFAGGNNQTAQALPVPHPRSTGNLIVLDESRGLIYVGTFEDGVMRSSDDGFTWTTLGMEGKYLRSLVSDPADSDMLYASAYGEGVWKTTSASGEGTFAQLTSSPPNVEELLVLGGNIYAAAGSDGIYRSTDGGQTWEQVGEGQIATNTGTTHLRHIGTVPTPIWLSIDGYEAPGGPVLFIGSWFGKQDGELRESVMRSLDGGQTWESITTDPDHIHYTEGGPDGPVWWMRDSVGGQLAQGGYLAAQIVVDPTDTSRVYLAGRAGVWLTNNAESDGPDWYPSVRHMNTTINHTIIADTNIPGRVYVGNTDRRFFYSSDYLDRVTNYSPASFGDGLGMALDPSSTPSRVYLATTDGNGNDGEIYSNPDPVSGAEWVNEGLEAAAGGNAPLGVAFGKQNREPVILAAVDGSGIWRKFAGTWTRVSSEAMATEQSTNQVSFAWPFGSPLVYLYDHESGVWRSNDYGVTWTKIWSKPSPEDFTGYVEVDPNQPKRLYVSANDGLYRLEGSHEGTIEGGEIEPKQLLVGNPKPGPIAYADQYLYVATQVTEEMPPKLLRSHTHGATFEDIADYYYRANAKFPNEMSIGPEGYVYVALQSLGAVIGVPTQV